MTNRFELSPESLFPNVFRYFGSGGSSFVLFSGVVISGIGLNDVINPAIWLLAAVSSMVFAHSLRAYVTDKYLAALFGCLFVLLAFGVGMYFVATRTNWLSLLPATPYTGPLSQFAVSLFVSLIFCVILVSYRRYSQTITTELPERIIESVEKYVTKTSLYYERFAYEIELFLSDDRQRLRYEMTVRSKIVNRTGAKQTLISRYPTPSDTFLLRSISINGVNRDLEDQQIYSKDGVTIQHPIAGKGEANLEVRMSKTFPLLANDIFTVYQFPAEDFEIRVLNHTKDAVFCWMEPLHKQEAAAQREGNQLTWIAKDAILPNQGVRLLWRPKGEPGNVAS